MKRNCRSIALDHELPSRNRCSDPLHRFARDLGRKLRVTLFLEADQLVLLGDLRHQLRGERAQFIGIQFIQVDRGVHPAKWARDAQRVVASRFTAVGLSDHADRVVGGERLPG